MTKSRPKKVLKAPKIVIQVNSSNVAIKVHDKYSVVTYAHIPWRNNPSTQQMARTIARGLARELNLNKIEVWCYEAWDEKFWRPLVEELN